LGPKPKVRFATPSVGKKAPHRFKLPPAAKEQKGCLLLRNFESTPITVYYRDAETSTYKALNDVAGGAEAVISVNRMGDEFLLQLNSKPVPSFNVLPNYRHVNNRFQVR